MFTTYPLPAVVQMFSVMKSHRPTHIAVQRAKGLARIRSVARTVSSRPRISRTFLALSNHGALSIFDASFKFARASI